MKRNKHEKVTFRSSFRLKGMDGAQPPGTYEVTTVEEMMDTMSSVAWLRTATFIRTPAMHTPALQFQDTLVNPEDLRNALAMDDCDSVAKT